MKILDRYILTTYLKTFLSVFVILMLIFVLQSIWLYISELAGKDLAVGVIMKFLLYVTPTLIPLILPLTVLLASIMVFGQFAENYEFAAMKSTGISLQRAMRSLSVFIVLLGVVTFIFTNNVIPWANYNFYNLRKNIAKVQPAMAIAEGQFNEIGDYNIKVEEKSGEKGQFLKKVVIHKKGASRFGNSTVIISKTGELKSNINSNILQLVLNDGHYYEDIYSTDPKQNLKKPHAKSYFEEYIINVDLEGLNDVDIDDKSYDNRYNMLNINSLSYTIDSLYKKQSESLKDFSKTLYNRSSFANLRTNMKPKKDSVFNGDIMDLFSHTSKLQLLNLASNTVTSTKQIITANKQNFSGSSRWLNKHVISLHEKYILGLACIILFFVGAPLGALIRKGGIGLPLVIAILLFLSYHFIGIFSKNSSLDGSLSPILATWLSTLIMLPLSIYLTKRATKDRGLFEFDHITEPIKKLLRLKKKEDSNTSNAAQLGLDDNTIENFDLASKTITHKIEDKKAFNLKVEDYKSYAKFTLIFYSIGAILILLFFVFKNNSLPAMESASLELGLISGLLFLFYFMMTQLNFLSLYNLVQGKSVSKNPILIILAFIFYPLAFIFRRNKIADDFSEALNK